MLNISRYFLSDGLCRAAGMSAGLLIRDSRDLNGFPSVFSRESPADGLFLHPKFSAEIARGASVQASRRPAAGRKTSDPIEIDELPTTIATAPPERFSNCAGNGCGQLSGARKSLA
jgi:hypothetical protein